MKCTKFLNSTFYCIYGDFAIQVNTSNHFAGPGISIVPKNCALNGTENTPIIPCSYKDFKIEFNKVMKLIIERIPPDVKYRKGVLGEGPNTKIDALNEMI